MPLQLVTGKAVVLPGVVKGTVGTDDVLFDSEAVQRIMERHTNITREYREKEFSSKLT